MSTASIVVWGEFVLAFVFGVVVARGNFCTMGAISDMANMGHRGRMRRWLLAIAVVAGALLVFMFADARFRSNPHQVANGVILGLLIVGALYVTGTSATASTRRRWRTPSSRPARAPRSR